MIITVERNTMTTLSYAPIPAQYLQLFKTKALNATIAIHNKIQNDEAFNGYEGDKDAFDELYKQVYVIVRNELFDDADLELVTETFFWYQSEIADGEREVDWYEYV
jgi:hypothetical protein